MKNILVTGGSGFIGSNFVRYMLVHHPEVLVVNYDALTYAGRGNNLRDLAQNPRYSFVLGDIRDGQKVLAAIKTHNIDTIVNFAAESHVDHSIRDAALFADTNVVGTVTLLNAALQVGNIRFHHVSTDEVFGQLKTHDPAFDETTPYAPRNPYAASKAASDHMVRSFFSTHGLPITISNCSNNYGPYQFPEKFIPLFITNLMLRKKVPVYGKGMNIRDWLFVDDHCAAIDAILRHGSIGETYCIGGDCERTNMYITRLLLDAFAVGESEMEYVPDRLGHDFRYAINHTKITDELNWRPTVDLIHGLEKTIEWYYANMDWWKPLRKE